MTKRWLILGVVGAAFLTGCSAEALVGGLLAGPGGTLVKEQYIATLRASVAATGGTPAQGDCVADHFRKNITEADLAKAASSGGDNPKFDAAHDAAFTACGVKK